MVHNTPSLQIKMNTSQETICQFYDTMKTDLHLWFTVNLEHNCKQGVE